MHDTLFAAANALALAGWLMIAAAPAARTWAPPLRRVAGRALPLLFAAAYVALIVTHWGAGGFGSLAQVRTLLDEPGLLLAGWLHYLAFDLFIGAWIAQRAAELRLPYLLLLPLLALTFLFGPAGLLAYALVRRTLLRDRHATAPAAARPVHTEHA